MALAKKSKGKNKKAKKATIAMQGSRHEPTVGHEQRLDAYTKRALELKKQDWYLHEIADELAKEFTLERVPSLATVHGWLQRGDEAVKKDIEGLQWDLRMTQFKELDRLKRKWLAIATADELAIKRWVMKEGELQPEMDENAVKEQIDATNALVKIMARQAKLLGLDLEKAVTSNTDGPASLQDLQLWIIGQLNINTGPNGAPIDVASTVLELRSGLPDDEETEDGV